MGVGSEDGALLIEPEADAWPELVERARRRDRGSVDWKRFREQMGLNGDEAVVLSGHQAGLWHAGIAAKYMALHAASCLGAVAWVIADLDDNRPTLLRIASQDRRGVWRGEWIELAEGDTGHPDAACVSRRPVAVRSDVPEQARLAAMAMQEARAGASDLAGQAHRAVEIVLERAGVPRVERVIRASATAQTDFFHAVVDRMIADPRRCVELYNAAVASHPDAGVRALVCRVESGRYELPLWRIGANQPRMPVMVDGGEVPREGLVPRGLLMTGMLRAAGCELFIHGTGGGAYDRVTEQWFRSWLGLELSPAAVVSATRLLNLGVEPVEARALERAIAQAHRARHDPGLLGDDAARRAKQALLERIDHLPRRSHERARLFWEMHAKLREVVDEHSEQIAALDARAERMREQFASNEAVRDRTWSIALHDPQTLHDLYEQVREAFAHVRLHP